MRIAERATPVAAVVAALSALVCCLPLGFVGAVGLAGLSVWAQRFRGWFLALAVALLVVGFIQMYRGRKLCRRANPLSTALLWVATAIVLAILLFPQLIASLLAG